MTTYLQLDNNLMIPRSHNGNGHSLSESRYEAMLQLQEATIADLRLQLQEQGWLRLGEGQAEFGRTDLGTIVAMSRAAYLKNPLVNRAVEIGALYVWGQDLNVSAPDENVQAVIDRFWQANHRTMTGQMASRLLDVERRVTGNLFLALFADRVTGETRVRSVPFEEVQEIVCNPEDRAEPWFYRRTWSQRNESGDERQRSAFYPDWRYRPEQRDNVMMWDGLRTPIIWDAPMMHMKSGAFPHWKWGVPEVYPALDWAKAYKTMLEHDATRSAALARWAYTLTTSGGSTGVAAAKTRLQSTLGTGNGSETNPPPVAGSTFIRGNKDQDLSPIDVSRAMLPADHSRPARLMAAAALGIPDHFFDADVGNFATSKTLDRPTELGFAEDRRIWADDIHGLLQWVIDRDLEAPRGLLTFTPSEEARQISLDWPDILERDVTDRVGALVDAITLKGSEPAGTFPREEAARQLMVAAGVEDVDEQIAALEVEWAEQDARRAEMARLRQMAPAPQPPQPTEPDQERESFVAALREVRDALRAGTH